MKVWNSPPPYSNNASEAALPHETVAVTLSTYLVTDSVKVSLLTSLLIKCDMCEFTTTTEKGIKTHKGHQHKEQLFEKEEDISLDVSPVNQEREE